MHFKKMRIQRTEVYDQQITFLLIHCTIDSYLLNHLVSSTDFLVLASNWISAKKWTKTKNKQKLCIFYSLFTQYSNITLVKHVNGKNKIPRSRLTSQQKASSEHLSRLRAMTQKFESIFIFIMFLLKNAYKLLK